MIFDRIRSEAAISDLVLGLARRCIAVDHLVQALTVSDPDINRWFAKHCWVKRQAVVRPRRTPFDCPLPTCLRRADHGSMVSPAGESLHTPTAGCSGRHRPSESSGRRSCLEGRCCRCLPSSTGSSRAFQCWSNECREPRDSQMPLLRFISDPPLQLLPNGLVSTRTSRGVARLGTRQPLACGCRNPRSTESRARNLGRTGSTG